MRSRAEHLQWDKDRALEYLEPVDPQERATRWQGRGRYDDDMRDVRPASVTPKQLADACASFLSDITKHPEINPEAAQMVFVIESMTDGLNTAAKVRAFIEGTN